MEVRRKLGDLRRSVLGGDRSDLRVEHAMSTHMATVAPGDTVRTAANRMADWELSAAVVESSEPSILTAHDVLEFVSAGHDPDGEQAARHATPRARSASPRSSLEEAAKEMVDGGFRHLVVTDAGRTVGVLSMRDVVRCWVKARAMPPVVTPIRKAMNTDFVTLEVGTTVQRAARAMFEREAPAAVVEPAEGRPYPGVFTEREVLHSLKAGADPARERLADHLATKMTFSAPGWSLKQAAEAMAQGGFQHIVVVDRHEIRGVISMREVVRRWVKFPE